MMRTKILAIEAAIGGGSIALLDGDRVLAKWHSVESVARSEELLQRIADLLNEAEIDKKGLSLIAVSNGPGSYTGTRIGLSTAMGLARSLRLRCTGVSVLRAVAASSQTASAKVVLLPIGRNGFCWQSFEVGKEIGSPRTGDLEGFLASALPSGQNLQIFAHHDAYVALSKIDSGQIRGATPIDAGRDLAVHVGMAARFFDDGLQPFYARDTPILTPGERV